MLSSSVIIPYRIREACPFLIPFGVIGIWRWTLFAVRVIGWLLYKPLRPKKHEDGTSANKYKSSDVTILVPTIDNGEEFLEAAKRWRINKPHEVIVVTSDAMKDEIRTTCDRIDPALFKVLSVPKPNKRVQLMAGIKETRTPIVALSDDDAIWTDAFLEWCLAPFDDDKMGGVGSKQIMTPVGPYATFWEVIADFRLTMRMIETSASTHLDGGMSCLSGRTAIYRTAILDDPEFEEAFVNEKWLGKYGLHSGDDKFITRWLVKNHWKMRMQNHPEACLLTTFKNDKKFLKQVMRWTRNTWRSDIRSIFVDRVILRRYPYVAFNMIDKFINPFPLLWGLCVIVVNLATYGAGTFNYVVLPVIAWLVLTRILRMIPHIVQHPSHVVYVPAVIMFQYYFTFAKVYAAFTLHVTDWGSRQSADDKEDADNVAAGASNAGLDMDSSDNRTADTSNTSRDSSSRTPPPDSAAPPPAPRPPEKGREMIWRPWWKRPAVVSGALALAAAIGSLAIVAIASARQRVAYWRLDSVVANHALTADRATNVGLYDPISRKTFLSYAGPNMDQEVIEYDHEAGTFRGPVAAASAVPDFHNYPRMIMARDGRLILVYTDSPFALYMAKSETPHGIAGGWAGRKINDDKPTYPCIVQASTTGDLYVFYRSTRLEVAKDYRPMHYVKSTDDGESWSDPRVGIDTGYLSPDNLNEVYADCPRVEPAHGDLPERFAMGWTMAGGGPEGEIHNNYHKDAHLAYFIPSEDRFESVAGEDFGEIIDYDEIQTCVFHDSGPMDETNKRIVDYFFAPSYLSDTRHPLVVFNSNKTLLSATWTGSSWKKSKILGDSASNVFDIEKRGSRDFRLFYSERDVWVITTSDGGASWKKEHRFRPEGGSASKVILIENAQPDLKVVALESDFGRYDSFYDARQYEGSYRVWVGKEIEHNPLGNPGFKKTFIDKDSRHYREPASSLLPEDSSSLRPSNEPVDAPSLEGNTFDASRPTLPGHLTRSPVVYPTSNPSKAPSVVENAIHSLRPTLRGHATESPTTNPSPDSSRRPTDEAIAMPDLSSWADAFSIVHLGPTLKPSSDLNDPAPSSSPTLSQPPDQNKPTNGPAIGHSSTPSKGPTSKQTLVLPDFSTWAEAFSGAHLETSPKSTSKLNDPATSSSPTVPPSSQPSSESLMESTNGSLILPDLSKWASAFSNQHLRRAKPPTKSPSQPTKNLR